jgi:hypothetical protein
MSTVVRTLEQLLDLTDTPTGTFVYIVPTEGKILGGVEKKGNEGKNECDEIKNGNKCEGKEVGIKEKGREQNQRGRRHRRRAKSLRYRAVHSDTALYKTLGTGLYFPRN